jgi:hypothetical protein
MRANRLIRTGVLAAGLVVAPLAVGIVVGVVGTSRSAPDSAWAVAASVRGGRKVQTAYALWAAAHERDGGDRNVRVQLGY